ncbi:MAG: DNA polymerase III subunit alpha, partial [Planctomycetota bacterium]
VLVRLARELGLGLVATNDVHYTDQDDSSAHDVLLCIGTGKRRDDENRLRFGSDAFYFRTPDEMTALFSELPESTRNTVEIAERCELDIEFGRYRYPKFRVPEGETEASHLRRLVEKGAEERYGTIAPRVRERIDSELGIIERMGFPGYMLIVGDIVRFARERGIAVGPGRGSATGSVVSYCLGITKLDPFDYDLIFERFMNEGRNEMPDIDLDFCQSRRDEMIDYVTGKYGRDHVAQIITFGTMAARASIRDVGRVLDVPLPVVDEVAKLVPGTPGMTLAKAFSLEPEIERRMEADPSVNELIEIAQRIEGLTRNPGKRAAGVVIGDRQLGEYCPLYRQPGTDEITTQYDMNAVTDIGLLKIDFLGLQTLTMVRRASELVEERTGEHIEPDELPLDDRKTFELFQRAETRGVFQFESGGMREMLRGAMPDHLEDLIALNAMYRPGPMDDIPSFVDCKHGREEPAKIGPEIDPVLEPTYGVIAYQEQVMRIAQVMGGFTLSEADKLRKAMGKKNAALMAAFRQKFMEGSAERGYDEGTARATYDRMEKFSGYGFNKSHSAAYALIAYQTAYLKANHPTEFMAALLTLDMGKTDKVAAYADEARRMGLKLLGPDVNEPGVGFTIAGESTIRFGLAAVKGIGEKAAQGIIDARAGGPDGRDGQFVSLLDFCERVDLRLANKSVIECLVKAGAFDSLGVSRARMFEGIGRALEIGSSAQSDRASGQSSLFDALGPAPTPGGGDLRADEGLPRVPDWPKRQQLAKEKSVLGIYVSGHPLSRHERWLRVYSNSDTGALVEAGDGSEVVLGGLLSSVQFCIARKSGKPWARVVLEDLLGSVEARIFSRTLETCRELLAVDRVVFLAGRVDGAGNEPALLVNEVIPFEEAPRRLTGRAVVRLTEEELEDELIDDVIDVIKGSPGKVEVYFRVERASAPGVLIRAGNGLTTGPGEELARDLEAVLGADRLEVAPSRERFVVKGGGRRQGGWRSSRR